ncbi:hypothetical protein PENTCL1PPCAC_19207, partial [Pristionchus entomophagus]
MGRNSTRKRKERGGGTKKDELVLIGQELCSTIHEMRILLQIGLTMTTKTLREEKDCPSNEQRKTANERLLKVQNEFDQDSNQQENSEEKVYTAMDQLVETFEVFGWPKDEVVLVAQSIIIRMEKLHLRYVIFAQNEELEKLKKELTNRRAVDEEASTSTHDPKDEFEGRDLHKEKAEIEEILAGFDKAINEKMEELKKKETEIKTAKYEKKK